MDTVRVFWKDKFGSKAVAINDADFDPALHRHAADGPWGTGVMIEATTEVEGIPLDTLTVAELRALAVERGVELKGSLTKAAIIEVIEALTK